MGLINRASFSGRDKKRRNSSRGAKGMMALSAAAAASTAFSQSAFAATDTWVGSTTNTWSALNGFNAVPTNGDSLVFGPAGAQGTTLSDDIASLTVGAVNTDGIDFNLNSSAFTINRPGAQTITLGSSGTGVGINDLSLNAQTLNVPLVLGSSQTVGVGSIDGSLTLSGAISGANTLTKTGAGLLTLSGGTNTFTNLTVTGGTVAAGGDGNFGSTTGTITLDGGALRTSGGFNLSASRGIKLGDAGAGTGGAIDTGNNNSNYYGVLANNGGADSFTKTGAGTLFIGGTNTYTGNTIINQGTLNMDLNANPPASISSSSALVIGGAPTVIGFVNNGNMPTFYIQGDSAAAGGNTQTFNGLTLNAGSSSIIARATSAGNTTVALGAIAHNPGGTVDFSSINGGGTGVGTFTTSNSNNASGILGGWAVINSGTANSGNGQTATDYATVSAGKIVALPSASYTTVTTGTNLTSSATSNVRVNTSGGIALSTSNGATTDISTLSLSSATNNTTTVTVGTAGSGSTGILRLGANGGLLVGNTGSSIVIGESANNGTLTAGGAPNTAGEITLVSSGSGQGNGPFTINSKIADNGSGAVTLTINQYGGSNNVVINGNNTYSGGTYINSGRVLTFSNTAFGTGTVTVGSNAQAYIAAGTYANNFNISGNNGFNGTDTPSAIRFNGGQTLSGTITLLSDATIGLRNSGGNSITGQITGNYNLTIGDGAGVGDITLFNTSNNFGGNLILNNEKVILGNSNVLPDGSAAGNVSVSNNSTLELNGKSDTINGLSATTTVGQGTVQNTSNGASSLTVGNNNQTSIFNGLITDGGSGKTLAIAKTGTGTLTLGDVANSYLGGTTVGGGILQLGAASGVANSTLGKITGALTVNTGGTLDLNGFSQTVGALSGTGGAITSNATGTPTLTFGDATALTTFAGAITNGNAASVAVAKQGSGTTDLTGANTYTGATNVAAGALQIGSGGSINSGSAVTLSGTASLILGDATGAVSQQLNSLTTIAGTPVVGGAASASTLTLNGAGAVTYANAFGGSTATSKNLNLIIAGTGTPISSFSGVSTYTGATTVNNGSTLNLTGSLANTAMTVNTGGTLTGVGNGTTTGITAGSVTAQGGSTIKLDQAANSLSVASATLGNGGSYGAGNYTKLTYTLGGSNAVEKLNDAGTLTLNSGGAFVNITNPTQTGTFTLASYSSVSGGSGFSLSGTTAGVTTQNVGRNTEILTVGTTALSLSVTGAATPGVAYFDGAVSKTWNDLSNASLVNFSTNLAGTTDAGNIPGAASDVILNASNATTNQGNPLTETLGASTIINSLRVNGNGTTTLGADGSTLTINALADSNTDTGGGFTGNSAGVGISIGSTANAFTLNTPVALGGSQSWTNNASNLFTVGGTVTGKAAVATTLTLANTSAGGATLGATVADGASGPLALVVNNTGAGLTTLSGSSNSYSGGTTLNGGTLTSAVSAGFGVGNVTVNPTNATSAAADNATLNSTGSIASTAAVTVNSEASDGGFGIGKINFNDAAPTIGSLAGSGKAVLNNAGGTTLTVGNSSNNLSSVFSGAISNGAGTGSLVKAASGTLDLTGTNTYSGSTAVNAGTLQIGFGGSIASTSAVTLGSGISSGLLALGDAGGVVNQTVGSLVTSGSGGSNAVVGGNAAVSTLTINNSTTDTYNGVLGGAGTNQNNLKLSITGLGTVTLANDGTFTGGTTVTNGVLIANTIAGVGPNTSASAVTVTSPGTVELQSTNNNNYAQTFGGTGKVLVNFSGGGSDTTIANFNNFTGTLEVANPSNGGNKLQIQPAVTTALTGATLQVDNGAQYFTGANTVNFGSITIIGTGNNENRGAIRLNTGTLGGNISLLGNANIGNEGGTLTGNISSGVAGTQTLTMGTGNSNGTALLSGNITDGSGKIALTAGFGTTTLSGTTTTYSGATTISGGATLKAGSAGAFSPNSAVTLANSGSTTLDTTGFNTTVGSLTGGGGSGGNVTLGSATLTTGGDGTSPAAYAGVISGSGGSIIKTGVGTQTLSGVNTYTGNTTIMAGSLALGSTGSIATSPTITVGDTAAHSSANFNVSAVSGYTLGGAQTLAGFGSVTGAAATTSGSKIAPGNFATPTVGTLAFGSTLNLAAGSILNYAFGAPGTTGGLLTAGGSNGTSSLTTVATALTLPSVGAPITLNLANAGGLGNGTYDLINFGSQTGFTASEFAVGTTPAAVTGKRFTFTNQGSQIDLTISDPHVAQAVFSTTTPPPPGVTAGNYTAFSGTANPGNTSPSSTITLTGAPGARPAAYLNNITTNPASTGGPKQYVTIAGLTTNEQPQIVAISLQLRDGTNANALQNPSSTELADLITDLKANLTPGSGITVEPFSGGAGTLQTDNPGAYATLIAGDVNYATHPFEIAFVDANPFTTSVNFGVDFSVDGSGAVLDNITNIQVNDIGVVPEPTSLAALGLIGGAGILGRRRRSRNCRAK